MQQGPIGPMTPLITALGGHYLDRACKPWFYIETPQPPDESEPLVIKTLLAIVRSRVVRLDTLSDSEFLAFWALLTKQRWRVCLDNLEDTYMLAQVALRVCATTAESQWYKPLREPFAPVLCEMLNEWIKPDEAFVWYPEVEALAAAMFGEGWCSFILAPNIEAGIAPQISVVRSRPPFLDGLVALHCEAPLMVLPEVLA